MPAALRSLKLDQRQLDRVLRAPSGMTGRHLARVGGYVTKAGRELANQRLTSRSGEYANSFRTTTTREVGGLRTTVRNSAPHATFIENGTRSHVILPRRATVLVFTGRGGGLVFARRVNHPGTTAQHILRDALALGMRRAR